MEIYGNLGKYAKIYESLTKYEKPVKGSLSMSTNIYEHQ